MSANATSKKETSLDTGLARTSGPARPACEALLANLAPERNAATQECQPYPATTGWVLRLRRGKRTISGLRPARAVFGSCSCLEAGHSPRHANAGFTPRPSTLHEPPLLGDWRAASHQQTERHSALKQPAVV
jgi:hypothetical protein